MKWSWIAAIAVAAGGVGCATAEPKPAEKPADKKMAKGATPSTNSKPLAKAKVRKKEFLHVLGSKGEGDNLDDTLKGGLRGKKIDDAFNMNGGVTGDSKKARYKSLSGAKKKKPSTASTPPPRSRLNVKSLAVARLAGTGKIDLASVGRVFSRRKGAVKYCYEKALKVRPGTAGKVEMKITIGTAGRITRITVLTNTTKDPATTKCMVSKIRSWRFPPAEGGSVTLQTGYSLNVSTRKE